MPERGVHMWITGEQFADLALLPLRTARYAISAAGAGMPVKRWPIQVRAVHGQGGRSGLRYEVALNSLPEALQRAFRAREDATEIVAVAPIAEPVPIITAPNQAKERERRWRIIEDALCFPARSPERAAEIAKASAKHRVPVRTVQRYIADFEASGGNILALGRKKPSDAGRRRIVVSRQFDAAFRDAGHPEAVLEELGEETTRLIRAAWASPAQRHGWTRVGLGR